MATGRQYRFVTTCAGDDPTTQDTQRTVRSHAASVSHRGHRTRRQAHLREKNNGQGVIVFDINPVDPIKSLPAATYDTTLTILARNGPSTKHAQSAAEGQNGHVRPSSKSKTPWSPNRLRMDPLSGETFSPLRHLTSYHAPYLPGVVDHYVQNLTIPFPELDGNAVAPVFQSIWLPIVFHDPVVFQVVFLFAATHYATFADPERYNELYLELLNLKQSALLALIKTVGREQTTPSICNRRRDTLIAAAAKMASYEAIFGTPEPFHLHMATVTRLLRQQGGLGTLGMKGFLARLLSFIDVNSACLLGTDHYLTDFGLSDSTQEDPIRFPGWVDEIASDADKRPRHANLVNLERFIGLMNNDPKKSVILDGSPGSSTLSPMPPS